MEKHQYRNELILWATILIAAFLIALMTSCKLSLNYYHTKQIEQCQEDSEEKNVGQELTTQYQEEE